MQYAASLLFSHVDFQFVQILKLGTSSISASGRRAQEPKLHTAMAQGKLKAKVQLPKGAKQKGGHQKKHQGRKRGGKVSLIKVDDIMLRFTVDFILQKVINVTEMWAIIQSSSKTWSESVLRVTFRGIYLSSWMYSNVN